MRWHSLLPGRKEYGQIARWLSRQAEGNGARSEPASPVTAEGLDALLAAESRDHVVVATGARYRPRRLAGTDGGSASRLGDRELRHLGRGRTGAVAPTGSALVLDDLQDATAPLTAVKLAKDGCSVRLVTRWPMIGMETIPEVYYLWVRQQLYETDVEIVPDHFVKEIAGRTVELLNVYAPDRVTTLEADCIVMVTGRRSENWLYHLLRENGVSVETIGDATAPRGTYEAVYEGHRQARKL